MGGEREKENEQERGRVSGGGMSRIGGE